VRLNQTTLKEMIREALNEAEEADPTKLKSQVVSTSQRKKDVLARVADTDQEFTGQEKGIVNQLEAYFSKLAALPGIDLVQHRAILQRVMKMLEKTIATKQKAPPTTPQQGEPQ